MIKHKKRTAMIFAATLVFILCSCEVKSNQPTSSSQEIESIQFNLSEYKQSASSYRSETYQASIVLANMASYEYTYWKTLGRFSDDMVDSAFKWLSENSDETKETVIADNESICSAYDFLTSIDFGTNDEASQIDASIRLLHDEYSALYTLVTEPSGSMKDFILNLSDLIDNIESTNNDLSNLLQESN